jgi:hypothetical protein
MVIPKADGESGGRASARFRGGCNQTHTARTHAADTKSLEATSSPQPARGQVIHEVYVCFRMCIYAVHVKAGGVGPREACGFVAARETGERPQVRPRRASHVRRMCASRSSLASELCVSSLSVQLFPAFPRHNLATPHVTKSTAV